MISFEFKKLPAKATTADYSDVINECSREFEVEEQEEQEAWKRPTKAVDSFTLGRKIKRFNSYRHAANVHH